MFRDFRTLVKTNKFRGWRLESEDGVYFLSKFDELYNDDEFRFYLSLEKKADQNTIHITKVEKIKNYKKIVNVSPSHPFQSKARDICSLFSTSCKTISFV